MSFRVKKTALSEHCIGLILALFKKKRITANVPAMIADIEGALEQISALQEPEKAQKATAAQRRKEVGSLLYALRTMHPDTFAELERAYTLMYPMPPPYKPIPSLGEGVKILALKVLMQSHNTHFIRMNDRGRRGIPVPLAELKERFVKVCDLVQKTRVRLPGPRGSRRRATFAEWMLDIYERHTGKRGTASPSGPFDTFIGYLLVDVAGESDTGKSRRTLVEAAIAQRKQSHPEAEMRDVLRRELTKLYGKERTDRFLNSRVTPYEVSFLEILESCS